MAAPVRHALQALAEMGARPDSVRRVGELARRLGLPEAGLSKIFQRLARRGLLDSRRGPNGGYRLTRAPRAVSLAAVVDAVDESSRSRGRCLLRDRACDEGNPCVMHHAAASAEARLRRTLESLTLADLASGLRLLALTALLPLVAAAAPAPKGPPEFPEDLGPAMIDVSGYPPEQQRVYRELFLPIYKEQRGGAARAINSPLVEIDAAGERVERRAHPDIAADPMLVVYTRGGWRAEVLRMKNRPPCCGACPILTRSDAEALRRFFAYDSIRRKTGTAAETWAARRRELIRRFAEIQKEKKP
ncbi:MAG: RrF2 family transcriptional regulator [Elusimicrobiota bacterium]